MNSMTLDTITTDTIRSLYTGRALGIREVCLAIERHAGVELDIADVHASLLRVATLYPCDDPQRTAFIERQMPFSWTHPGAPDAPRVLVYPK